MLLAAMFANAGNYGLPVVMFAFGQSSLSIASLFFVVNISLAYTAGTVIASMSSVSLPKAILNLLKLPLVYAVLLAFLFINTGWKIPLPLERATKLLSDASIPCMLLVLGLQLHKANLGLKKIQITLTSVIRLVVSPALAFLLLPLFGFNGPVGNTIVLQAGMPTAVMTTLLATEFDAEPAFATAAVFATTLLSPLTLTPLISLLGG
jgi:predicted permease